MCVNVLLVGVCFVQAWWCHRGQKRPMDLLELEFWMAVSHHVGARTRSWVSYKNSKSSYPLNHLSSPLIDFSGSLPRKSGGTLMAGDHVLS